MKKSLFALICVSFVLGGCTRTNTEMWEDTKTASRYVGKGMRSFLGKHVDGREYVCWDMEADFVPLADDERYNNPELCDYGPSRESPGDPGSPIPGIDSFKDPTGKIAAIFRNIHFDLDNYSVKGKENLESLREVADYLERHHKTYVFVEGHADERGASAYNLALGSRRANSVRTFLINNGVDADQLFTISYGKEHPLVAGHDETTWKQNRRGQFKLYER